MALSSNPKNFTLHTVYLEEVKREFRFPLYATYRAIRWVKHTVTITNTQDLDNIGFVFDKLGDWRTRFRAHVAGTLFSLGPETHMYCLAICDLLKITELSPGERYNVAKMYSDIGVYYRQSGQLGKAAQIAKDGLQIIERLPYRELTGNLHYNLGIACEQLADFDSAHNAFKRASYIYRLLGMNDYAYEAEARLEGLKALSQMQIEDACNYLLMSGKSLRQNGRLSEALLYHKIAFQAALRSSNPKLQALVINNISSVYFHQGDFEQARLILETGIDMLADDKNPSVLSQLNSALGATYVSQGLFEDALDRYQFAYMSARDAKDEYCLSISLYGIGTAYSEQGNLLKAREKYQEALEIRRRLPDIVMQANAINQLGYIAYKLGELEKAEHLNREALALRVQANDLRGIAESLGTLSTIIREIGTSPRTALVYSLRAARLVEGIRRNIGTGDESRIAFMNQISNYYRDVIALACKNGDSFSAFWAFQRLQNRSLIDRIARSFIPRPPQVPEELYDEEQRLLARLTKFEANPLQASETLNLLESLYFEKIRRHDPNYARARLGTPLARHELVEFLAAEGQGATYLEIAEWGGTFYGILAGANSDENISPFSSSILPLSSTESPVRFDTVIFYKKKIENALQSHLSELIAGSGTCYVVPHEQIARLPIHVLEVNGRPLIEHKMIRYRPQGFFTNIYYQDHNKINLENACVVGDCQENLLGARLEANEVATYLRVKPILGKDATKENILHRLTQSGIFHFAGHAYFDKANYRNSGLILRDGVLTGEDIINRRIRLSLVVLNACESGVQGVGLGAELEGFIRGLLLIGVRNIVCTLWRVDDTAAKQFGEAFYDALINKGLSPVKAAHIAQLALLQNYRNQPVLWAPYIFVG